ncbi:MAG: hydrogenase maturation factor [Lachnospiraceae bacterium]|nr:hydrogenase maturation factor [Lachnospiraceae bacterium]
MSTGKLSESVLKRSVLKQLKNRRQEVVQGAGVGEDCALFSFPEELAALSVSSFTVFSRMQAAAQLTASVNNVAAAGAIPVALMVSAILPEESREDEIKWLVAMVESVCANLNLQAAGGDTRFSSWVTKPQLSVTVLGKAERLRRPDGDYRPGQEIVMTKWLGLAGTAILADQKRTELEKRLPPSLIDEAIGFTTMLSVLPEAGIAAESGVSGMHDLSRGGIFAALWELAERAGTGLEIEMKLLPVRQETIEITEVLGINPYELQGAGSLLIVCDKGNELVGRLKKENIPAAVIGRLTEDRAKIVYNQEEKRYLDRPVGDHLEKFLSENQ